MVASLSIAALLMGAVSASMGTNDVRIDLASATDAQELPILTLFFSVSEPCHRCLGHFGCLQVFHAARSRWKLLWRVSDCSRHASDGSSMQVRTRPVLLCQHFDNGLSQPICPPAALYPPTKLLLDTSPAQMLAK
jgi:hypothetical protein